MATGLVTTIPTPVHQWDPELHSQTGTARPLPLTRGPAASTTSRSRTGATRTLPLTRGAVTSTSTRRSAPAGRLLPITMGVASSVAQGPPRPVAAQPFTVPLARGCVSATVRPVAGVMASRPLGVTVATAVHAAPVEADPRQLPLVRAGAVHTAREWRFATPTVVEPYERDLADPHGHRRFGRVTYGTTVWRDSAGWHAQFAPGEDRLAGADRIFRGGRIHPLLPDELDELTAAGFAEHLTLEEI